MPVVRSSLLWLVAMPSLIAAKGLAQVSVPPEFTVEVVAAIDGPGCLAFAHVGSAFGSDLFAASVVLDGGETGINDFIFTISETGVVTLFATLMAEADPGSLKFPPSGSLFGDFLFVSANNRDGGRLGDQGGTIQRIDLAGNVTDFTPVGLPAGLGEPANLAFGPGDSFGTDLFVANSSDVPADIMRVDPSGSIAVFVNDGLFTPFGLQPVALEFGPSGAFGSGLFFSDRGVDSETIRIADAAGNFTAPFATLSGAVVDLDFGRGGPFGNDLYAAVFLPGAIFRVEVDGTTSVFATGFAGLRTGDPLEFSPDGDALFVADHDGNTVYKISLLDTDGDGIPDCEDGCPESELSLTVVIDGCDSGVENMLFDDGCTMADLIAECADGASNHGGFVSCVAERTNEWKQQGIISGQEKGAIQSCGAQADIP